MKMKYEHVISEFLKDFPEYFSMYKEHINLNEEELPHVFFGETLNEDLPQLIMINNIKKLEKIFNFLERMSLEGDQNVKDLLSVTILARLGDEPDLLKYAKHNYMGVLTKKASVGIEKFWGRDFNIH